MPHPSSQTSTRRRMLAAGASLVATVGAGCVGSGRTDGEAGGGNPPAKTFKIGGKVSGWVGQAPEAIDGTTNPTLTLEPGTTYELTWENLDGVEHELIIEDGNGKKLKATESASEKGATRTITFEATEKMAQYYCEYHPQSMRGSVELGG